jgi:hypothetical protein
MREALMAGSVEVEHLKGIATTCADLRQLALNASEPFIAHMLDMVILESRKAVAKRGGLPDGAGTS